MRLKVKTGIAKKDMMPYLFLMPAMFFILAFLAYPLVTVFFYLSLIHILFLKYMPILAQMNFL